MLKHVYILGAGFSYPLGGPLFKDLLTPQSDRLVVDQLRGKTHDRGDVIKSLGSSINQVSRELKIDWDAERWLETITSLKSHPQPWLENILLMRVFESHPRFRLIDHSSNREMLIDELVHCLNSRLAIETTEFLTRIPDNSERWLPYKKWFKKLTDNDTIITFNYDLVCETLGRITGNIPLFGPRIDASITGPTILKLHGSANWYPTSNGLLSIEEMKKTDMDLDLALNGNAIIGVPGMKSNLAEEVIGGLWWKAMDEIKLANVVSIVGYSFPQTDNFARDFLLDALAGGIERKLAVDVVLGPSSEGLIANRIKEMLSQVFSIDCSCKRIPKIVPAYSQDYLHRYRYSGYQRSCQIRSDRFESYQEAEDWAKFNSIEGWMKT